MSYAEVPVKTEAQQLLDKMDELAARQDGVAAALNKLGEDFQWAIGQVQGIFQMFGSPQMMAMLPQMMNGAMSAVPVPEGNDDDG